MFKKREQTLQDGAWGAYPVKGDAMTDVHDRETTTVISTDGDRSGPAVAITAVLLIVFVGFMIWLLAFSGVVFNRHSGSSNVTNNNVRIQQPATQPSSGTGGGGSSAPTPASS